MTIISNLPYMKYRLMSLVFLVLCFALFPDSTDGGQDGIPEYTQSIDSSTTVYTIDFSTAEGCVVAGYNAVFVGEYEKAIELLERAIEIDQEYLGAYIWLAKAHAYSGESEVALSWCEQSLELYNSHDPDFFEGQLNFLSLDLTDVYKTMGLSYGRLELYEESFESYSLALEMDPEDPFIWKDLGLSYLDAANYHRAIECFSNAIDHGQNHYMRAWELRGWAHEKNQDYQQAVEDYSFIINWYLETGGDSTLNTSYSYLWYRRAYCFYKMAQYEEALDDLGRYGELLPESEDGERLMQELLHLMEE